MLMRERAADIVLGACILLHALDAAGCVIGIEDDAPTAARALQSAIAEARDERIRVAVVPAIYPAGGERQLIAAVFDEEVPSGGLPSDIGFVCQNVGTAAAVARWLRDGQPLIRRIVTVTGDGVHDARNLDVALGTPMSTLIADCGGYTERMTRLIMGGSMMGLALPNDALPVIKATNCIVAASALDLQPRSAEMPCIRCGNCSEVCPATLLPQQLIWYAQARDLDALDQYGLMDCIECGCCDYVCPSQIPLAARFEEAKPALARFRAERSKAAGARALYEARNERLERLEAEQRAKLLEKRQRLGERRRDDGTRGDDTP
jgi:electron transport complex protein RnfC